MVSVFYYIKTKNISLDRRAHNEWDSLVKSGAKVSAIYSSDEKLATEKFNLDYSYRIKLLGGAAPKSLIIRLLGAIYFSIYSFLILLFSKRKAIHWLNDPILFPLVLLIKTFTRGFVVWDHHELPPNWVFSSWLLRKLFKLAYESSDINIHANPYRKDFLEKAIGVKHDNVFIISNRPTKKEMSISEPVKLKRTMLHDYIYIQNSIGKNRCDIEMFTALKKLNLRVVHAGNVDKSRLEYIKSKLGDISFCEFVGPRSLGEINFLLKNSIGTLVFYKNLSLNNWYCEPNRLYQAMAQGVSIVGGNNPTIVESLDNYNFGYIAKTDGSDSYEIELAIKRLLQRSPTEQNEEQVLSNSFWEDYDDLFHVIIKKFGLEQ